jgi:hypothetical protein
MIGVVFSISELYNDVFISCRKTWICLFKSGYDSGQGTKNKQTNKIIFRVGSSETGMDTEKERTFVPYSGDIAVIIFGWFRPNMTDFRQKLHQPIWVFRRKTWT